MGRARAGRLSPSTAILFCLGTIVAAVLAVSGCAHQEDGFYLVGEEEQRQRLAALFDLLDEATDAKRRVALMEQISGHLVSAGYPERMRILLTSHVESQPRDPYNAYYLLLVAQSYEEDAPDLAQHYYDRLVTNYSDVSIRESSAHYMALRRLINMSVDSAARIDYYRNLIDRFPERIDVGKMQYYLAKTYEQLGEWDAAYAAYKDFLKYPDTAIPGYPDAHDDIRRKVAFFDSSKDWTMDNLDDLVSAIKYALWRQDSRMLLRLRAEENFFAMSWEQQADDFNSRSPFNLGIFLERSRVRYAEDIDVNSNAQEAYLRTWGWSHRISTWYLYFRRVDFPANPEIHGDWEWAGILFGEAI
ncbi:MAG: tetratricopeptide repeat protein [bacterium]